MDRRLRWAGLGLVACVGTFPIVACGDDDDHDEWEEHGRRRTPVPVTVAPLEGTAALYAKECGACHVAYPARMLPARSWSALLGGLDDHFGDDASLPEPTRVELVRWLAAGAGDVRGDKRVARLAAGQTPLRITELAWFRGEHDELSAALVADNPEVKRYANCGACHPGAADDRFEEDAVRIPGRGAWDD